MIATGIQLTDMSTKWGLVTVSNTDGSINRQYTISGRDADLVTQSNNLVPPGCTYGEWFGGLAILSSRPCNIGNAVVNEDGTLVVNFGVSKAAGLVTVSLMQLQPSEWAVVDGVIYVDDIYVNQLNVPYTEVHLGLIWL